MLSAYSLGDGKQQDKIKGAKKLFWRILTENLQYIITGISLIIVQIVVSLKQDKVRDVKTDCALNKISGDIKDIKKDVERIDTLVERVNHIEADVTILKHDMEHLKEK